MIDVIPRAFVNLFFQVAQVTQQAAANPQAKQAIDASLRALIGGSTKLLK